MNPTRKTNPIATATKGMKDLFESDAKTFPLSFNVSHNSIEDDWARSNAFP